MLISPAEPKDFFERHWRGDSAYDAKRGLVRDQRLIDDDPIARALEIFKSDLAPEDFEKVAALFSDADLTMDAPQLPSGGTPRTGGTLSPQKGDAANERMFPQAPRRLAAGA